jgi:hypothetical protein
MPTIKGIPGPHRLFFWSFDCAEPTHVHAQRERATCKFWLDPVVLAANHGLTPRDLTAVRRIFWNTEPAFWRPGVSTAAHPGSDPRVKAIEVTADLIIAHLVDGRTISVPLAWSWRLSDATPDQRAHYEIIGDGTGVHWPAIDEDISVRGMLERTLAPRPAGR